MRGHKTAPIGAFLAAWLAAVPAMAQQGASGGEWRSYTADAWGTKYSPLDQIDGDNFRNLELAWRWRTADSHLPIEDENGISLVAAETVFAHLEAENPDLWVTRPGIARLSATPLMVDGVLYLATPLYQAAAIDARTGETLWVHNPRVYESGSPPLPSPWNHRGVAYWEDGEDARIIWGTGDGHLTAVDARTGLLAADFGDNGRVSLEEGIPRARENPSRLPPPSRSPPLVVGDTIIVGSSVHDFLLMKENAPGFARAYDARTGRHKWDFHTVPQSPDEFGSDTWLDEAWRYSGNTNVWGNIAADPELGYVYLPTSTPTSDYYGGHRIGDNLFAESLICVDLETGQRVWHFQMVHHGVWDYDNPTGPNLLDITVDGRRVKALAQVTKQGFVYVFDRVTGEPIWPIEERPVATDTDLEGEVLAPTQPFPTRPAPFEYQGATLDDLIDFTPEVRRMALEAVEGFRLGPLYTPLSLNGTIFRPSAGGGASWGGGAVDPETGHSVHPVAQRPFRHAVPRAGAGRGIHPALHPEPWRGGVHRRRQPAPDTGDAAGATPVEAAVLAHDRHRHEHRRTSLDDAPGQRRPHPQPSAAAPPRPAAPGGRQRAQRAPGDQDAARAVADRRRHERRAATGSLRQGNGRAAGGDRPAWRGHRDADDVPARRPAAHRRHRWRRCAVAGCIQAAVIASGDQGP